MTRIPRTVPSLKALAVAFLLISLLFSLPSGSSAAADIPQPVLEISGARALDNEMALENVTKLYPASRSTGSAGCNASGDWVLGQMSSLGLQTYVEYYDFPSWDLRSFPTLSIAPDGNIGQTSLKMNSFLCEQWSSSTGANGVNGTIAYLPLPEAATRQEIGLRTINTTAWDLVDTTGKILLVGKELRWVASWEHAFIGKIGAQRPLAVISAYSYEWMAGIDEGQLGSAAGRPLSSFGPYLQNLNMPSGAVNYTEGLQLRSMANSSAKANVVIDSFTFNGQHRNLIGTIPGSNASQHLLVTAHYDSVTTNGFCDNGAGVSGMLEMARVLSSAYRSGSFHPVPDIMFVAFDGEELGLIGSLQFVRAHQDIMRNITAVFNLDCIGSRDMRVTPTEGSSPHDAKEAIVQAASKLGVTVGDDSPGGSDQESFLHPDNIRANALQRWGVAIGGAGMTANGNAVLLISYPLFISDLWTMNQSGWIHTRNDRSGVPGWVSEEYLQQQISVTTLAVMSISAGDAPAPQTNSDIVLPLVLIAAVIIVIAVLVVWYRRR